MKSTSSQQDQEIIEILERLRSLKAEYPPELRDARRAAFIKQVAQRRDVGVKEIKTSQEESIIRILESLKSAKVEYPPELLSAQRARFVAQIARQRQVQADEELAAQDQEVIELLGSLKAAKFAYPSKLLTARRAAFVRQIRRAGNVSLLEALRSAIQDGFRFISSVPLTPMMKAMRTSLVVASVLVIAFFAAIMGNRQLLETALDPSPTQVEVSGVGPILPTSTQELQATICKPGYVPPLCLAKKFDTSQTLTFQGNGARPAVAKDTLPG
ncbi:MAG TPA: hypothetical protein VFO91_07065, partial [Anaerolineales bacterium]|nr:hypothetical protein [Anaerolineales bacterium]